MKERKDVIIRRPTFKEKLSGHRIGDDRGNQSDRLHRKTVLR